MSHFKAREQFFPVIGRVMIFSSREWYGKLEVTLAVKENTCCNGCYIFLKDGYFLSPMKKKLYRPGPERIAHAVRVMYNPLSIKLFCWATYLVIRLVRDNGVCAQGGPYGDE